MSYSPNNRELAAILAGLRLYQRAAKYGCPIEIDNIATDGGQFESLALEAIDDLCERLNCEPASIGREEPPSGYYALHDGLSDMIEYGRLRKSDIPNDYDWLVDTLEQLANPPPQNKTFNYENTVHTIAGFTLDGEALPEGESHHDDEGDGVYRMSIDTAYDDLRSAVELCRRTIAEIETPAKSGPMLTNTYDCPRCDTHWEDEWECACDDRCPGCNLTCSPTESKETGEG